MNSARGSSWLTRTWLSLLLLVPFAAGCDARPGSRPSGQVPPQVSTAPAAPVADLPPRNVAVPPGPRRPAVAVRRASAGKPNPKLREAVVRATREARAETLAAKNAAGRPVEKPVADARPWGLKTPPAPPAAPAPTAPAAPPAPPRTAPQPTVAAAEPAPAPGHDHAHGDAEHGDSSVAALPGPGPLDGLDWNVPMALIVGALAAILLGARRP